MENKVNSVHYCGLLSKGFPETPPLSLRLYCLETMSVCLASAINERQILYFTYIHERCTEQCCNRFLFIRLRLHACCVIHFLFLYIFHVCLACLEVREGILSHTHLFESTGYGTHSPHIYLYVYFFLEVYEWIAWNNVLPAFVLHFYSQLIMFDHLFICYLVQILYFITDLEIQLGSAPPPHNNTSIATWSGLLTGCRDLINVVCLQV